MKQAVTTKWSIHDFCSNTLRRSNNIRSALQDIVIYIASKLNAEICSIYLADKTNNMLVLEANHGLSVEETHKVKMSFDEGLVGLVAQKRETIEVYDPIEHPRFKAFNFLDEDKLKTFFGYPIVIDKELLGVLVIQTQKKSKGNAIKNLEIETIAKEIGEAIKTARLTDLDIYGSAQENIGEEETHKRAYFLKGKGASVGIAIGYAHFQNHDIFRFRISREEFSNMDNELKRLKKAADQAKAELAVAEQKARAELGDEVGAIFQTHIELMDDELFEEIKEAIQEDVAAGPAIDKVLKGYQQKFRDSNNAYLKEREHDIIDIKNRLLKALYDDYQEPNNAGEKQQNLILVAKQLLPTDVIQANINNVKGLIQTSGGITSHGAILANSISIPMISGIQTSHEDIHEGDFLIMDANSGMVYINPTIDVLDKYYELLNQIDLKTIVSLKDTTFQTKDKKRIFLMANIGLFAEAKTAFDCGADGIGLYRTEFPFLAGERLPNEEEQFDLYQKTIQAMDGKPVTIRTLDLGGDKFPKFYNFPPEKNPFLGFRSIRISLSMIPEFKSQIKAILRAAIYGPVRLMVPMISNIDEIIATKKIINQCMEELKAEKKGFKPVPFGVMIEVPSAALMIDQIFDIVDFASIGTNDLIQYTLAVDRNNAQISSNFQTMHPAVLKLLKLVGQAGKSRKKDVSICGEMAGNPLYAPVIIGMDIKTLSMNPKSISTVKNIIENIPFNVCKKLADQSLKKATYSEVKKFILDEVGHII